MGVVLRQAEASLSSANRSELLEDAWARGVELRLLELREEDFRPLDGE